MGKTTFNRIIKLNSILSLSESILGLREKIKENTVLKRISKLRLPNLS
jgi:hypothetical protein